MNVKELNHDQLACLKQDILLQRFDAQGQRVSYDDLANVDNLVTDEDVFAEFSATDFSEDDFF